MFIPYGGGFALPFIFKMYHKNSENEEEMDYCPEQDMLDFRTAFDLDLEEREAQRERESLE